MMITKKNNINDNIVSMKRMEPFDKSLYIHRMFLTADRETLNSFEKRYYDLYKQSHSKANGLFFLKEEQDPFKE